MEIFVFALCLLFGVVIGDRCNFEHGLCRFIQDKNDDFNWSTGNLETPTVDTGPSYDHTLGENGSGHYLFIESSGKNSWTAARLSSPKYPASKSVCVTFYYHMFGKDAGRLSVYLRQKGRLSAPLWSMTANQGNEWIKVVLWLRSDTDYQVVFEATRGSGFRSDIALDDIAIKNGSCKGANNIVSSTSLLDAVIGTKRHSSPGGEMLPHLLSSNNIVRQPNAGDNPNISKVESTNHILDNKFVTNLMIVGLLFWSVVFITLCAVVWRSRRSKKYVKSKSDRIINRSAISTQIEFENPCVQQPPQASGTDFTARRPAQSKLVFPKTQPDEDEEWDSFKARVGLDKEPSSFKDRYSFTAVDKDLYMYYEEEQTAETWRQSSSGDYV